MARTTPRASMPPILEHEPSGEQPPPRMMEDPDSQEAMRDAFADPTSRGALAVAGQTSISTSDGIITAQKVAVERNHAKILANIKTLASMAGEDWYYRFPVKSRDGKTDWIEGPSIKCANNVARFFGNCQIDTRVFDLGQSWLIYARFVDYETGFSYTRPFQQRKGQTAFKSKDQNRQLDIAFQIGVSKAIRNVVCNALEAYTNFAFEEAKKNIVEKVGKNLDTYRKKVIERMGELEVPLIRVEKAVGRVAKDWLASDVARLIAELQSIGDGMATAEETWPVEGDQAEAAKPVPTEAKAEPPAPERKPPVEPEKQPVQAKAEPEKAKAETQTGGSGGSGQADMLGTVTTGSGGSAEPTAGGAGGSNAPKQTQTAPRKRATFA